MELRQEGGGKHLSDMKQAYNKKKFLMRLVTHAEKPLDSPSTIIDLTVDRITGTENVGERQAQEKTNSDPDFIPEKETSDSEDEVQLSMLRQRMKKKNKKKKKNPESAYQRSIVMGKGLFLMRKKEAGPKMSSPALLGGEN